MAWACTEYQSEHRNGLTKLREFEMLKHDAYVNNYLWSRKVQIRRSWRMVTRFHASAYVTEWFIDNHDLCVICTLTCLDKRISGVYLTINNISAGSRLMVQKVVQFNKMPKQNAAHQRPGRILNSEYGRPSQPRSRAERADNALEMQGSENQPSF
jgi:hypothetical protein